MFLVKLIKRLVHLAVFVAIAGFFAAIFLGYFWYNTGIGPELYKAFANADKSNGILAPGSAAWFDSAVQGHTKIATAALTYVIPAGFSILFGTGVYAVLSIAAYLSWRAIKKSRQKKRQEAKDAKRDAKRAEKEAEAQLEREGRRIQRERYDERYDADRRRGGADAPEGRYEYWRE